jgi:hypothetical protein
LSRYIVSMSTVWARFPGFAEVGRASSIGPRSAFNRSSSSKQAAGAAFAQAGDCGSFHRPGPERRPACAAEAAYYRAQDLAAVMGGAAGLCGQRAFSVWLCNDGDRLQMPVNALSGCRLYLGLIGCGCPEKSRYWLCSGLTGRVRAPVTRMCGGMLYSIEKLFAQIILEDGLDAPALGGTVRDADGSAHRGTDRDRDSIRQPPEDIGYSVRSR